MTTFYFGVNYTLRIRLVTFFILTVNGFKPNRHCQIITILFLFYFYFFHYRPTMQPLFNTLHIFYLIFCRTEIFYCIGNTFKSSKTLIGKLVKRNVYLWTSKVTLFRSWAVCLVLLVLWWTDLRPVRVCAEPASGSSTANTETKHSFTHIHSQTPKHTHTCGGSILFAVSEFSGSLRDHGVAHLPLMTAARARAPAASSTRTGAPHMSDVSQRSVCQT